MLIHVHDTECIYIYIRTLELRCDDKGMIRNELMSHMYLSYIFLVYESYFSLYTDISKPR